MVPFLHFHRQLYPYYSTVYYYIDSIPHINIWFIGFAIRLLVAGYSSNFFVSNIADKSCVRWVQQFVQALGWTVGSITSKLILRMSLWACSLPLILDRRPRKLSLVSNRVKRLKVGFLAEVIWTHDGRQLSLWNTCGTTSLSITSKIFVTTDCSDCHITTSWTMSLMDHMILFHHCSFLSWSMYCQHVFKYYNVYEYESWNILKLYLYYYHTLLNTIM